MITDKIPVYNYLFLENVVALTRFLLLWTPEPPRRGVGLIWFGLPAVSSQSRWPEWVPRRLMWFVLFDAEQRGRLSVFLSVLYAVAEGWLIRLTSFVVRALNLSYYLTGGQNQIISRPFWKNNFQSIPRVNALTQIDQSNGNPWCLSVTQHWLHKSTFTKNSPGYELRLSSLTWNSLDVPNIAL